MGLKKEIQLRIMRRMYQKNNILGVVEKINIYKMSVKKKEYIWYCKRTSCPSIVLKTSEPILDMGATYICKGCNERQKGRDLVKANKGNLKKYFDEADKKA